MSEQPKPLDQGRGQPSNGVHPAAPAHDAARLRPLEANRQAPLNVPGRQKASPTHGDFPTHPLW